VGYLPWLRVPAVALEIVGGIIIGPSVLGWVRVDLPVAILALFGLAFLLFLAGLEIDVHRLRGRLLRFAVFGYLVTLVLGYGAGASFTAAGWVSQPLLLAIALSATSLGLVVPVLKDAGQVHSQVGQSALYPALHKLEQNGWIEAEWKVSETNRRAKYYHLTKKGRKRLEVETTEWRQRVAAIARLLEA